MQAIGVNTPVFNLQKPRKVAIPFETARRWRGGEHLFQRKYDGRFLKGGLDIGSHLLVVEEMRERGQRGEVRGERYFVAHDMTRVDGQDISAQPTRIRWRELCRLFGAQGGLFNGFKIELAETGNGGEFLEAVIAAGGEGVVAKDWDAPLWADIYAAKRLETFVCVVIGFCGGSQAVQISIETGLTELYRIGGNTPVFNPENPVNPVLKPAGKVSLRGGKCERVRIGSLIKVEGMGLTVNGCIREPRVCQDTPDSWLIRY